MTANSLGCCVLHNHKISVSGLFGMWFNLRLASWMFRRLILPIRSKVSEKSSQRVVVKVASKGKRVPPK